MDYCLRKDLSLDPDQEEDILVVLEGQWMEDTVVSRHPGFDESNIKVVGELADGGDHMYVSFKNLSKHPVTILGEYNSCSAASERLPPILTSRGWEPDESKPSQPGQSAGKRCR